MGHRILILDDDMDFNSLLADIFGQAGYAVTPELNPQKALALIQEFQFDLVVTDQRMPGLSGRDFLRHVKKFQPKTPVIMVSGYLDNETIRELIREGVGGVFLKPLNVFSLLKRTAKLLEQNTATATHPGEGESAEEHTGTNPPVYHHALPFPFSSFPCRDAKSTEFANKLYALRNFKSFLALTGPPGTNFSAVCRDFEALRERPEERFLYLTNKMVEEANLLRLAHENDDRDRLTMCFLEADTLDLARQRLLPLLARKTGSFANLRPALRFIVCLSENLDMLYDNGRFDEELYVLISSSELVIPALDECRDDVPLMAQQIVTRESATRRLGAVPRLDVAAKSYLRERQWPGNYTELQQTVLDAMTRLRGNTLTQVLLESAAPPGTLTSGDLRQHLSRLSGEYIKAVYILCANDNSAASQASGLTETTTATLWEMANQVTV